MSYKLGILDQSPIEIGKTAVDAFVQTANLAKKAEEWGYHRFWVSEHHQAEQLAGASPEVLIANLIAHTKTIRLGSGGIMLQHYSPYKVAENFHVLANLAPGRIDLGIGKAPGGLPASTKALHFDTGSKERIGFEERFSFLDELLLQTGNAAKKFDGAKVLPPSPVPLETFLLGASKESAELAASKKWSFVFAGFIDSDPAILEEAISVYRRHYPAGTLILALPVFAADTQKRAEELTGDQLLFKIHLQSGRKVTVQTLEQAESFAKQLHEPYEIKQQTLKVIAGTRSFVKAELDYLYERYGVDEFILHSPSQTAADRFHSFELISTSYRTEKIPG